MSLGTKLVFLAVAGIAIVAVTMLVLSGQYMDVEHVPDVSSNSRPTAVAIHDR